MTKETAAILRLIDALKRKDTDQDGNWGFPSFQEELEDIRIMLEESVMTTNPNTPEFETVENILDKHAEYYIRQTMKFFQENGESPALSKNNEGDLVAKQSLKQSMRLMILNEVIGEDEGYDLGAGCGDPDHCSSPFSPDYVDGRCDLRNEMRLRLDQALTKFFGEG